MKMSNSLNLNAEYARPGRYLMNLLHELGLARHLSIDTLSDVDHMECFKFLRQNLSSQNFLNPLDLGVVEAIDLQQAQEEQDDELHSILSHLIRQDLEKLMNMTSTSDSSGFVNDLEKSEHGLSSLDLMGDDCIFSENEDIEENSILSLSVDDLYQLRMLNQSAAHGRANNGVFELSLSDLALCKKRVIPGNPAMDSKPRLSILAAAALPATSSHSTCASRNPMELVEAASTEEDEELEALKLQLRHERQWVKLLARHRRGLQSHAVVLDGAAKATRSLLIPAERSAALASRNLNSQRAALGGAAKSLAAHLDRIQMQLRDLRTQLSSQLLRTTCLFHANPIDHFIAAERDIARILDREYATTPAQLAALLDDLHQIQRPFCQGEGDSNRQPCSQMQQQQQLLQQPQPQQQQPRRLEKFGDDSNSLDTEERRGVLKEGTTPAMMMSVSDTLAMASSNTTTTTTTTMTTTPPSPPSLKTASNSESKDLDPFSDGATSRRSLFFRGLSNSESEWVQHELERLEKALPAAVTEVVMQKMRAADLAAQTVAVEAAAARVETLIGPGGARGSAGGGEGGISEWGLGLVGGGSTKRQAPASAPAAAAAASAAAAAAAAAAAQMITHQALSSGGAAYGAGPNPIRTHPAPPTSTHPYLSSSSLHHITLPFLNQPYPSSSLAAEDGSDDAVVGREVRSLKTAITADLAQLKDATSAAAVAAGWPVVEAELRLQIVRYEYLAAKAAQGLSCAAGQVARMYVLEVLKSTEAAHMAGIHADVEAVRELLETLRVQVGSRVKVYSSLSEQVKQYSEWRRAETARIRSDGAASSGGVGDGGISNGIENSIGNNSSINNSNNGVSADAFASNKVNANGGVTRNSHDAKERIEDVRDRTAKIDESTWQELREVSVGKPGAPVLDLMSYFDTSDPFLASLLKVAYPELGVAAAAVAAAEGSRVGDGEGSHGGATRSNDYFDLNTTAHVNCNLSNINSYSNNNDSNSYSNDDMNSLNDHDMNISQRNHSSASNPAATAASVSSNIFPSQTQFSTTAPLPAASALSSAPPPPPQSDLLARLAAAAGGVTRGLTQLDLESKDVASGQLRQLMSAADQACKDLIHILATDGFLTAVEGNGGEEGEGGEGSAKSKESTAAAMAAAKPTVAEIDGTAIPLVSSEERPLRNHEFSSELHKLSIMNEGLMKTTQSFVATFAGHLQHQKANREQSDLERSILPGFWIQPQKLFEAAKGLQDKLLMMQGGVTGRGGELGGEELEKASERGMGSGRG